MPEPLIIQYTNILHAHGLDSTEANHFKTKHNGDSVFQQRAEILDTLFVLKKDGRI